MWSVFGPRWKVGRAGGRVEGILNGTHFGRARAYGGGHPHSGKALQCIQTVGLAMPCGSQPERTGAVPHLYRR